jgi:hypothetical protein
MGFIGDILRSRAAGQYARQDAATASADKLRQKALKAKAKQEQSKFYAQEEAGKFDARVSQAQRDLAQAGKKRTDTSGIAARQAMELSALSQDPRALAAGITGTTQRAAQAEESAKQADLDREIESESKLAGLEDTALSKNIEMDKKIAARKLVGAEQDEATAEENMQAAELERREAALRERAAKDAQRESIMSMGSSLLDARFGGEARNGAKVKKTPGEFSHKRNPIDIVQKGAKIGEMTGGEYILNPQQASKIDKAQDAISKKKRPSQRDLMGLYSAVRSVFNQPQFD